MWKQHCEEMALREILFKSMVKLTFEFQPSADPALQCWAADVLTQSATYPSPYANVHKGELSKVNESIGKDTSSTWKVPNMETRQTEIKTLEQNHKILNGSMEANHKKEL